MNLPPIPDGYITRRLVNVRVGEEVRRLRIKAKLTMGGMARSLGVSTPYLSDVEHGRRSIKKRLHAVAKLLGVSVQHFVDLTGICPACGGTGVSESAPSSGVERGSK